MRCKLKDSHWIWYLFQNTFQWNYGNRSPLLKNGIVMGSDEEEESRMNRRNYFSNRKRKCSRHLTVLKGGQFLSQASCCKPQREKFLLFVSIFVFISILLDPHRNFQSKHGRTFGLFGFIFWFLGSILQEKIEAKDYMIHARPQNQKVV